MIIWEDCVLEDGVLAEFPLDFLSPAYNSPIKVFYWDQDKKEVIHVDNRQSIITIPLYETLNDNVKEIMECEAENQFDYEGFEIISGNKRGFGVFKKNYTRRNK